MLRFFLGVGGCIILYWLLHETDRVQNFFSFLYRIFMPFALGAALAFILNVPMRGIERHLKKIKSDSARRVVAMILTFLLLLLILALVFYLLIPQLVETVVSLVSRLPDFFARIQKSIEKFLNENPVVWEWIVENTDFEKWDLANIDWPGILHRVMTAVGNSLATILNGTVNAIGTVADGIVNLVIGIVFSLYCLFRKEILARQGRKLVYSFLPEKAGDTIVRVMRLTNSTFSNFISGQCVEACILGCMFAVSMMIFRMPYVPLVSVLVAVTALVPVVGAFVGCVLGAFFILVNDPVMAFWFIVMFLILQQIENNMIYPRVVGTSIGLPGMWVLVAVSIGGEIMGIAGMLLMIPLASVCYALLREITDKRLKDRGIAPEKVQNQPPELESGFKARHNRVKEKSKERKIERFRKKKEKNPDEVPGTEKDKQ